MSQPVDLDTIEKKAFSSKFQDGLYDIQLGLLLLGAWFLLVSKVQLEDSEIFVEAMPIYLLYCVVVSCIPWLGKRWITARRMGTMKPGVARRAKIRKAGWFLALIVAVQAFLVLLQTMGIVRLDISRFMVASLAGLIVFLPMAVIAHRNDFFRSYIHAIVVGLSIFFIILLETGSPLFWSGSVILAMGLFIFIRFLIRNPLPDDAISGDQTDRGEA